MAITVASTDISEAETLLLNLVAARYPTLDLGAGSAIRELGVSALAPGLALILATVRDYSDKQSLQALATATPSVEVDAAVDALASNIFAARRAPTRAAVTGRFYYRTNTNKTIPAGFTAVRNGIAFRLLSGAAIDIPGGSLRATIDGVSTIYYVDLQMESFTAGQGASVTTGTATNYSVVLTDLIRIDVITAPVGGRATESTADFIARLPSALTVRNLVNQRSITYSVLDKFPAVSNVLVVGAGEPEMIRDVALDDNAFMRFHTGGYTDVYVDTDIETVTETVPVGTTVFRPDNQIVVMRKVSGGGLPALSSEEGEGIVLVHNGLQYLVTAISGDELEVYSRTPFTAADDEAADPEDFVAVPFTLGRYAPYYNDLGTFTGYRSRQVTVSNAVTLTGPVYALKSAIVVESGENDTEVAVTAVTRTTGVSGLEAQSPNMVTRLSNAAFVEGASVELTYERPIAVADVNTYLNDPLERVACASVLGRARHPVYVTATIYYEPVSGVTYTSAQVAALLTAALGAQDEICEGDVISALSALRCVHVREFGGQLIAPSGATLSCSVDVNGKLVLPTSTTADVTGRTVRFLFTAENIIMTTEATPA